ncbi:caspase family protein [uncultured Alistipes sp.]|uniref:caspase family protein n=1 Tax=uncultured Alistipes sp. TaxID=538949 RepID=UPI0025F36CF4|nr:caspase family protein [uncultured Alistipes sp.]
MKHIVILLLTILPSVVFSQSQAVSMAKPVSVTKELKPAILELVKGSVQFFEPSGNKAIDATEECYIQLQITNTGIGDGYGCVARVTAQGTVAGIEYHDVPLDVLRKGESYTVKIPVTAEMKTEDGQVEFAICVEEPNGFGVDKQYLMVNTRAFEEPWLQVTDYTITGTKSTVLKKKQPFDLQILIQNTRYGVAKDVQVRIELPENVLLLDGKPIQQLADMAGGQTNSLVYSLIANNNYTGNTIPVKIMLAEKYGKYAENRQINLSFNQTITSNKIIINEQKEQREDISIATLTSDVDRNIPRNPEVNDKTFAVIIANENYTLLPAVPYALNDGSIFSEYCHLTLGIPRKNIHFVKDATLNNMRAEIDWIQQIACAYEGKARVIVYYAGHGIPDEKTRTSYLLPVDSYGSNVLTGYNLSDLYAALSKYPTFSTIILLDACFSGAQRNGEMLVSARSVAIRSKVETPNGNLVVLSAATGDETAYPYQEKKHGMFTYFLLKKLQETNGDAHLGEIAEYVKEQVQKCSLVENLKGQTPTIISSRKIMTYWQDLKLK